MSSDFKDEMLVKWERACNILFMRVRIFSPKIWV